MHARTNAVSAPAGRALQVASVIAGSALMALCAQISIHVPFSPVPITGQTFAVPLIVALLGTRGATLSLVLYLAEGVAGLPVFAPTLPILPGFLKLFGPTGGYLVAFPLAAYVTGRLLERGLWPSYAGRVAAIFLGSLVVFAGGAAWLAHYVGWPLAIATGVVPFILGDVLKTLLAAAVLPWVRARAFARPL
jgi:biotin transport system substrate-specific component